MDGLKRSIRYQLMESKSFILKFWSVVLILDVFFYILLNIVDEGLTIGIAQNTVGSEEIVSVLGANIFMISIALIAYSYERNYESFPIAISFSMTRKDYFMSFLVDNIFIAFLFATIQGILMKIDPFFVKLIGKVPLYNLLYFNTKTDNVIFIIFALFIVFLGLISLCSLIASLNYKLGYKMWIGALFFHLLILKPNMTNIMRRLKLIENTFNPRFGLNIFIITFIGVLIAYMLNYLIVSITEVKARGN